MYATVRSAPLECVTLICSSVISMIFSLAHARKKKHTSVHLVVCACSTASARVSRKWASTTSVIRTHACAHTHGCVRVYAHTCTHKRGNVNMVELNGGRRGALFLRQRDTTRRRRSANDGPTHKQLTGFPSAFSGRHTLCAAISARMRGSGRSDGRGGGGVDVNSHTCGYFVCGARALHARCGVTIINAPEHFHLGMKNKTVCAGWHTRVYDE